MELKAEHHSFEKMLQKEIETRIEIEREKIQQIIELKEANKLLVQKQNSLLQENKMLESKLRTQTENYLVELNKAEERRKKQQRDFEIVQEKYKKLDILQKQQISEILIAKETVEAKYLEDIAMQLLQSYPLNSSPYSNHHHHHQNEGQVVFQNNFPKDLLDPKIKPEILLQLLEAKLDEISLTELKDLESKTHHLLMRIGETKLRKVQIQTERDREQSQKMKLKIDQMAQSKMCKICEDNEMEIVLVSILFD
jgi:hypothetical protein